MSCTSLEAEQLFATIRPEVVRKFRACITRPIRYSPFAVHNCYGGPNFDEKVDRFNCWPCMQHHALLLLRSDVRAFRQSAGLSYDISVHASHTLNRSARSWLFAEFVHRIYRFSNSMTQYRRFPLELRHGFNDTIKQYETKSQQIFVLYIIWWSFNRYLINTSINTSIKMSVGTRRKIAYTGLISVYLSLFLRNMHKKLIHNKSTSLKIFQNLQVFKTIFKNKFT